MRVNLCRTVIATLLSAPLWSQTGKLAVYPGSAILFGEGSRQHVLVTWTDPAGIEHDVTPKARMSLNGPNIAQLENSGPLENSGMIRAVSAGKTKLTASYEGLTAEENVEVRAANGNRELSFVKDIVPI